MKIEELAKEHLMVEQTVNQYSSKLLKEMLENRASKKDNVINNQLLKKLVKNYAVVEQKLVELNDLKNKFLGIAAHDLRNPLTSIRGFCEILLEDEDSLSEDQKEMLDIIHEESENMLTLVNDLLDVSVIESGKLQLQLDRGSIKKVIEDRIKLSKMVAKKKNIALNYSLSDIPDILLDANRIAQVIDNLIGNAVKFSPSGTKIFITLKRERNMAKVSIQDEGPGISKEDQAKLFGDFQKLTARPTGGEKSTGLGLAIVKKIIEAHKGALSVESKLGKGSTFSFELPLEA